MSFRYWYKDPDGDITEIVDRVRENTPELVTNAEEGSVGTGKVSFDVPTGDWMFRGHRLFVVTETEAVADDYGGVVHLGYSFRRKVSRDLARQGAARTIEAEIVDLNTLLSDRILHGNDCDRPEETDLQRVAWLLGTAEMGPVLNDTTYVASTDPENMDAVNYEGQKCIDVLDDCAQQSGRNYFLLWQDSGSTVPDIYLWYRRGTGSTWSSSISISNVPGEYHDPLVDEDPTVFAPSLDTELTRDPSRVYSNVRMAYDGGAVNGAKDSTAQRFRRRWATAQAENVKTKTKAARRARRYLDDIESELDEIATAILVPRRLVNAAMAGQLIPIRHSALPGYEAAAVNMRIKDRTVREVNPELVELALTLTGDDPGDDAPVDSGTAFATLMYTAGAGGTTTIHFVGTGDTGAPGYPVQPTVGPFTFLSDSGTRPYYGIQVDADGTLDSVTFEATWVGVVNDQTVVTWAICLNGTPIATVSKTYIDKGGLYGLVDVGQVEATDVEVADGDVLTATVEQTGGILMFKVPAGVTSLHEQLTVNGGTLA